MVQGRQLGIPATVRFIGGNGLNSAQLAKLAGPAAEGAISGAAWFIGAETPGNQAFVKAYQEKYSNPPDQFAAQAYTGVYLLAYAIRDAGKVDERRRSATPWRSEGRGHDPRQVLGGGEPRGGPHADRPGSEGRPVRHLQGRRGGPRPHSGVRLRGLTWLPLSAP